METLKNRIIKERGIGEKSAELYIRNLRIIGKKVEGEDQKGDTHWLEKFEKVKAVLMKEKLNTRKTRLSAIVVALKVMKIDEKLTEKYSDMMYEAIKEYKDIVASGVKSKKQEENWASLEDLKQVWNTLKKEVYAVDLHKKKKIVARPEEKELLQKFMVASLYTLMPPRRNMDYTNLTIVDESEYKAYSKEVKDSHNYLVMRKNGNMYFSFGDYKTNNYKTQVRKNKGIDVMTIVPRVKTIIRMWRKFNPEKTFLITNNRGGRMSANSLTKYLMKIFNRTGKKSISSTMLRHIYITETEKLKKFREAKEEAEKIAKKMGHSLKTQQDYVKTS
tara:strand:+ start:38 stop:1033 length:996 start_codon:yes stop_codon:yes gene_type:complete